jgi:hypothetical protein
MKSLHGYAAMRRVMYLSCSLPHIVCLEALFVSSYLNNNGYFVSWTGLIGHSFTKVLTDRLRLEEIDASNVCIKPIGGAYQGLGGLSPQIFKENKRSSAF